VLSNKKQAARAGLVRHRTPTQCSRDDFWGEISLNGALHWFPGGSTQLLNTGSAEEPDFCVMVCSKKALNLGLDWLPDLSSMHHYTTFGYCIPLTGIRAVAVLFADKKLALCQIR